MAVWAHRPPASPHLGDKALVASQVDFAADRPADPVGVRVHHDLAPPD